MMKRFELVMEYLKHTMHGILFYTFSGISLLFAMFAVVAKRAVHSVLALVVSFFGAAWVLLTLRAEFLAFLLIVIYVGAIAVLFLFCAMMLEHSSVENEQKPIGKLFAALCSLAIFMEMVIVVVSFFDDTKTININVFSMHKIAFMLYYQYMMEFQMLGIILLIAMIGAILLTESDTISIAKKQNINSQVLRSESIDLINVKTRTGVDL